jgi:hypothetical protein
MAKEALLYSLALPASLERAAKQGLTRVARARAGGIAAKSLVPLSPKFYYSDAVAETVANSCFPPFSAASLFNQNDGFGSNRVSFTDRISVPKCPG